MFNIEFYKDRAGNEPIVEYIRNLNTKALTSKEYRIRHKKIVEYLEVLSQFGTRAGEPYVKHIVHDIWDIAYSIFRRYVYADLAYYNIIEGHFDADDQRIHGPLPQNKQTNLYVSSLPAKEGF